MNYSPQKDQATNQVCYYSRYELSPDARRIPIPREDTCIYLPAEQVESLSSAINLYNRGLCGGIIQVILERDKKEGYLTRPANPVQNF